MGVGLGKTSPWLVDDLASGVSEGLGMGEKELVLIGVSEGLTMGLKLLVWMAVVEADSDLMGV